jgi:hypothetical protein
MTSICVSSTPCILAPMARVDNGLQTGRPAAGFSAILKAQAGLELLQIDLKETHLQMMQVAIVPRRPDVDAMLLQLFASRKTVLSVAAKSGRPAPAPAAGGATVANCMLAEEDNFEASDLIDVVCADGGANAFCTAYEQGLLPWHPRHCAHGLAYGFRLDCALQSAAMTVAPPVYAIVWTPAAKPWVLMRSSQGRSGRRQKRLAQGNVSKSQPRDHEEG